MSLIINKISSCSTQINYSYFESDFLFGYEVVGDYKVDFADVTFTNDEGVLFEGIEALRAAFQRPNLVARIGADEFINGRLTSQSFEQSVLAGSSSCSITIEESKRLDNYSANEFAKYIPSPQFLSSFQENFSFSRSGENYTSTRNTSIVYKQDAGDQFLNNAKRFLIDTYFKNRPNLGYQVDGISENGRFDDGFRPLVTESIDFINLSVSLQETLQTSFIDGDHSRQQTYSLDVGQDGYTSKKYNVAIKAIKEPLEQVALNACIAIIDEIISENVAEFIKPIEIGKGINRDGGNIILNISFSNDPRLNSGPTTSYNVTRSKSGNLNFYDYSITTEITVIGKNEAVKNQNLKSAWTSAVSSYETKIQNLFTGASPIYEKSRDFAYSSKEPKILDTAVYTEDASYNKNGNVLKEESSIAKTLPLERNKIFTSPETNGEIVEVANKGLLFAGSISYTTNVVYKMSAGIKGLIQYLEALEGASENYLSSDTISANFECVGSRVRTHALTEK